MPSYFFPCLALVPGDLPPIVKTAQAVLRRREWETTTFDFATLGASHKLQFSWHLLDVFLNDCHLEIEIRGAPDFAQAQERVRILQVMLYLKWVSPFIMPVGMTHTLRDYSGLNYRDSATMRPELPPGLQSGFVSADGKIEGWLHEPTFQSITVGATRTVSAQAFTDAVADAERWMALEMAHQPLKAARLALQTAPAIPDLSSSLLHIWQGIEALFPNVSTEVSFRLGLLVSQLCAPVRSDRLKTYEETKRSYARRSRAAHGSGGKLDHRDWVDAWDLLILCLLACLAREALPSEDILTRELLG
ncbi:hypothetical protein IP65_17370 [Novosphingobium sp. AAP1]|uniref:hypothetical protein n=1 Tax=Novosphingobium sp. AAP1 TaxID=1523413 RepID=UPI0006B9399C|nr:hypothetical protein [Novosphingobium sp. AAP1]KPF52173.1 hypothetical protein IP65_17370 [Novosphingobium sp. AAP1]